MDLGFAPLSPADATPLSLGDETGLSLGDETGLSLGDVARLTATPAAGWVDEQGTAALPLAPTDGAFSATMAARLHQWRRE